MYDIKEFKRFASNAFIFKSFEDHDFVVVYPTKQNPHFGFYYVEHDQTDPLDHIELGLPKDEKWEIIGIIKSMNLDNYWEDPTDWANQIYRY